MEAAGATMGKKGGMADAGRMTKAMGKMGPMIAKMGAAVSSLAAAAAALGAVVGVVAVFAGLIMKAWEHAAQMNKAILESASALDVAAASGGDLERSLDAVREASTGVAFNLRYGLNAQEFQKTLSAFQEAGLTFEEINDRVEEIGNSVVKYRKAVEGAVTYARLFGQSTDAIAQSMAEYMETLGLSLEGVETRFSAIAKVGAMSGFNVKRFYSTILEATSGMSMYNVRLEESAGLLMRLGKILGTKAGGEFFKSLAGGYIEESATDKIKRIMLTGQRTTAGLLGDEARRAADDFVNKMGDTLQGELASFGINVAGGGAALQEALSGMSQDEQLTVLGRINKHNEDLGRQFSHLIDVQRGASGTLGEMMIGMDFMGPQGKLLMEIAQIERNFGNIQNINSAEQLAAVEGMLGLSHKQFMELREIDRHTKASWNALNSQQTRDEWESAMQQQLLGNQEAWERYQIDSVKQFGAYISKNGEIVSASLDETGKKIDEDTEKSVNNARELLAASQDLANLTEESVTEDTKLARQVASNTLTLKDVTENLVAHYLEKLWGVAKWWKGLKDDKLSREQVDLQMSALSELQDQRKGVLSSINTLSQEFQAAQARGDTDEATRIQKELRLKEIEQRSVERQIEALENLEDKEGRRLKTEEDFLAAAVTGGEQKAGRGAWQSVYGWGLRGLEKWGGIEEGATVYSRKMARRERHIGERVAGLSPEDKRLFDELSARSYARAGEVREKTDLEKLLGDEYDKLTAQEQELALQTAALEQMAGTSDNEIVKRALEDLDTKQEARENRASDQREKLVQYSRDDFLLKLREKHDIQASIYNAESFMREFEGKAGKEAADRLKGVYFPGLEDAILHIPDRGPASAWALSPGDVVGVAKGATPAGAAAGAAAAAGGGGTVMINIYGGDQQKVYQTVKRVLKEARLV